MSGEKKPRKQSRRTKRYVPGVQCPTCLAAPGAPCLNYKGIPKASCPERTRLAAGRPAKRSKRKLTQGRLFPDTASAAGEGV